MNPQPVEYIDEYNPRAVFYTPAKYKPRHKPNAPKRNTLRSVNRNR